MSKVLKKILIFAFALCLVLGLSGMLVACKETPPEEPAHTEHVDSNNDGKCDECGEKMPDSNKDDDDDGDESDCKCKDCDKDECECKGCDEADCECDGCNHDDPDLNFPKEYIGKWKAKENGDVYMLTIKEHRFTLKKGDEKVDVKATTTVTEEDDESICEVKVEWGDYEYDVYVELDGAVLIFDGSYFDEDENIDVYVQKYFVNTVPPTGLSVHSALDGVWEAHGMEDITVKDGALLYGGKAVTLIGAEVEDYSDEEIISIFCYYYFITADDEVWMLRASVQGEDCEIYVYDLEDTFSANYVKKGELPSAFLDYVGTWSAAKEFGASDEYVLVITEDGIKVTLNGANVDSSYAVGRGGLITVTIDGVVYDLRNESDYILILATEEEELYLFQSPRPSDLTVDWMFAGEWFAADAKHISISEDGVLTYGGEVVQIIASSYAWGPAFGYNYYFVTEGGDGFCLKAVRSYYEGMSLTLTDMSGDLYVVYASLADYVGIWEMIHEAGTVDVYTLVITMNDVKVYNGEVDTANLLDSSFAFDSFGALHIEIELYEGVNVDFEVLLESECCISLKGEIDGGDPIVWYFLEENAYFMDVNPVLAGTWKAADSEELVISADGSVSYGGVIGLVIGSNTEYNYYQYRILFGTKLGIIEVYNPRGEDESFAFIYDDEYYSMSLLSRETVYVPEDYRNTTWSGDGITVRVDEDGNVYINDELVDLISVQDWGHPYCRLVWNNEIWTLELNDDEGQLFGADWYELTQEGVAPAELPSALRGTNWTAEGNNEYADKTWGKTITIEFAQDGTITLTIDDVPYSVTLKKVSVYIDPDDAQWNSYSLVVIIDGNKVTWWFSGDFSSNSFESGDYGFFFTATKNKSGDDEDPTPVTYTVVFYNEKGDSEVLKTVTVSGTNGLSESDFPTNAALANYRFVKWVVEHDSTLVEVAAGFAPKDYANAENVVVVYAVWQFDVTIGATDNSLGFPGYDMNRLDWTGTINPGEKVTLSGTHGSLGEANWQTVFGYIWSGDIPAGIFRADAYVADELALEAAENWAVSVVAGPTGWANFRSVLNGTVTISFDWRDVNVIYLTFVFAKGNQSSTMIYKIESTSTFASSYKIGLAAESAHAVLTSYDVTTEVTVHDGHDYVDGICMICGQVQKDNFVDAGFTADSYSLAAAQTGAAYNLYAVDSVLTKGHKLVVIGTQTGAIGLNWESLLWELNEGWTGRSDSFGWSYNAANFTQVVDGKNDKNEDIIVSWDDRAGLSFSSNIMIRNADGLVVAGDNWDLYKTIAKDCTWRLELDWAEDGNLVATLSMTANSGANAGYTFSYSAHLAIANADLSELHLHFGGEKLTTFTVNAHKLV